MQQENNSVRVAVHWQVTSHIIVSFCRCILVTKPTTSQDLMLLQVLFKIGKCLCASSALDRGQIQLHRRITLIEDRCKESTKKKATVTDTATPNSTLPGKVFYHYITTVAVGMIVRAEPQITQGCWRGEMWWKKLFWCSGAECIELSTKTSPRPSSARTVISAGCRTGTKRVQERDTTWIPGLFSNTADPAALHCFLAWAKTSLVQYKVPANKH